MKPERGQLSKLSGVLEEPAAEWSSEDTGVKRRVTGLKAGALGSYLGTACLLLGVYLRGDEAFELMSVKGL